jgi:hypothetical protein
LLADKVFETVNMNGRKLRLRSKNQVRLNFRQKFIQLVLVGVVISASLVGFFYFMNPDNSRAAKPTAVPAPGNTGSCFATEVVSYTPQKRIDGSIIPLERRNAQLALGQPQHIDALNFVSLGFGGELILKFQNPIANGTGNDVQVVESTFGGQSCTRYPEKVQAFASQDGCRWVYLGEGCQDASFDLGSLAWAQYIRLHDVSPLHHPYNGDLADGYDVDGIICLNGASQNTTPSTMVYGSAQSVIAYNQGTRKNGTAIHASRTNPNQALGEPQDDDLGINFTTLGFNGSMILKFDFVIFDGDGADLRVVETSFGQQNCSSYPEKAYFEGSLDGLTWTVLGEICLDGTLDFASAGLNGLHYLRITDRSPASFFTESSDGFDVDGIEALHTACSTPSMSNRESNTEVTVDEKAVNAHMWPNPFKEHLNVLLTEGSAGQNIQLNIFNFVGQPVYQKEMQIKYGDESLLQIETNHLNPGIYMVNIKSAGFENSYRVVKTR